MPGGRPRGFFLLLTAVSPLLMLYAGEARAYALLALFDLALFLLATREPARTRDLVATAIVSALAVWTHYLALFFIAALVLACLAAGRRRSCAALAAGAALSLPWLPILLRQPREATAWMREPAMNSAFGFLSALGGAGRIPPPFGPPLPRTLLWIAAGAAIALIAATAAAWRADPRIRIGSAAVLLTLGGALAVSPFRPVAFAGRTEMAVLPVWLWVIARAAGARRPVRWIAAGAAGVAAAACLLVLRGAPRNPPVQAVMLGHLENAANARHTVVAGPTFYVRARLASDRGMLAGRLEAFPADLAEHPGWFVPRPPPEPEYALLARRLPYAPGPRALLLLDTPYWTPRLKETLLSVGTVQILDERPRAVLIQFTRR